MYNQHNHLRKAEWTYHKASGEWVSCSDVTNTAIWDINYGLDTYKKCLVGKGHTICSTCSEIWHVHVTCTENFFSNDVTQCIFKQINNKMSSNKMSSRLTNQLNFQDGDAYTKWYIIKCVYMYMNAIKGGLVQHVHVFGQQPTTQWLWDWQNSCY